MVFFNWNLSLAKIIFCGIIMFCYMWHYSRFTRWSRAFIYQIEIQLCRNISVGNVHVAFMLLLLIFIYAISLWLPFIETRMSEAILFSVYNVWTFIRFFHKTSWSIVIIPSIVNLVINFFVYIYIMEWIVAGLMTK